MSSRELLCLGLLGAVLLAARCTGPIEPVPGPQPDAAAPELCESACDRLAELGCPEAQPTPEGGTCVDVCRNVESSGYATLDPACIARADSCDALQACVWVSR